MITQRVFGPFATLARLNTTLLSSGALFERIFDYLDLPVEVEERSDALALQSLRGDVEFDNVRFAYTAEGRLALDGISFRAQRGMLVALVGPSGAGKTSVTYLLERFYDPTGGAVRIDGHDLRDLKLASVIEAVGAVMQETYLFHASLADNIRYGRLEATDDEVRAAAESAGLSTLVDRLPDGLETILGERGFRLSGGERQRVAIARALLKDPPILVLDEATSSLDSRLEREIREATDLLAAGRTTIVIAHRLSTVVRADLILVLDGGRIIERGRHADLLALDGLYASLYREQFLESEGRSNLMAPVDTLMIGPEQRPPPVLARVVRVEDVTPRVRRVVFGSVAGGRLPVAIGAGSGRNLKLHFPRDGQSVPILPSIGLDGPVRPPEDVRPFVRTYTARTYDAEAGEIAVDFVLHEEDGPASRWARGARPGSLLGIAGPRGMSMPDADWYLLMGDETALPNIAACLETLPPSARGQAFVEVAAAAEEQPLKATLPITWLHRAGVPAGRSSLLTQALDDVDWPAEGRILIWAAGESSAMQALRKAIEELEVRPSTTVLIRKYWTLGVAKGSMPKSDQREDVPSPR
jgi:NADPH-dependent ferric siderophore reductase/ABC-type multidrug transport system ATPase subunit